MAEVVSISGINTVLRNLKQKSDSLARGFEQGATLAGLMLQRESQKRVPIDTGNLKAAAFTRKTGSGLKARVNVGYAESAGYAIFVHEAVGMVLKGQPRQAPSKGNYWDPQPQAQAKFLEQPARELMPKMRAMILSRMKFL